MKIFDSSNPLWTPTAVGTVISFIPNAQGAPSPSLSLTGNAHITAYNLLAKDKDVISPVYSTFTLAGVIAGDTCVVNGVTYTAVASGATGNQFNVGGTDAITATNLATVIAASLVLVAGAVFQFNSPKIQVEFSIVGTGNMTGTAALQVSTNGQDFITHPGLPAITFTGVASPAINVSAQIDGYPFVRCNLTALSGTGAVAKMFVNGVDFK